MSSPGNRRREVGVAVLLAIPFTAVAFYVTGLALVATCGLGCEGPPEPPGIAFAYWGFAVALFVLPFAITGWARPRTRAVVITTAAGAIYLSGLGLVGAV